MFDELPYFNRVFQLAQRGVGFMGPKPLWAIVLVSENNIVGEAYSAKYGDLNPLEKLQNFACAREYDLYSNILFESKSLGKLKPKKIFYSTTISSIDEKTIELDYLGMGITIEKKWQRPGEHLNKAFFHFQKYKIPYSEKVPYSQELNPAIRSSFDCVVFNLETIKKFNDDFKASNLRTPLRILLSSFGDLDFSWKILSDDARRNTMVISTHEDVVHHPEIVRKLEQLGVAQLSVEKIEEQVLLSTLARYKFISVLFEC